MEGSLRTSFIVFLLAGGLILLPPGTLAGTTGSMTGVVLSTAGAPISGVRLAAVSPSQTATVITDASGRFAMLTLAPDTYTITASKNGFETSCRPGAIAEDDRARDRTLVDGPR
jgi:hypothetical protein